MKEKFSRKLFFSVNVFSNLLFKLKFASFHKCDRLHTTLNLLLVSIKVSSDGDSEH